MIAQQYLDKWTNLHVLAIGEAMLDCYLEGTSNRLCREAPVPIVDINSLKDVPGGAANTAANIARLGASVSFLSVIGTDLEGDRLKRTLQERGISTHNLIASTQRQTLLKQRISSDSQLLLRCDRGSTENIDPQIENQLIENLNRLYPTCDATVISDYGGGILTPRIIQTIAQLQTQYPRTIVVDSKQLKNFQFVNITAIKPNYQQAIQLLEISALKGKERIQQIVDWGAKLLDLINTQLAAVTLDAEGAIIFERNNPPYIIPSHPTSNSQATGAGDTFVSGLTLALAAGAAGKLAASIASATAAIVVTQPGTTTCSLSALHQSLSGNQKLVVSRESLVTSIQEHRNWKHKIVFTNGCFDLLHLGHVTYLKQAKQLGDILIVGVNSDESIRQLKGANRPVNCLSDRLAILSALESVDYVIPFAESTPSELIKIIRPDIYVKGGDYTPEMLPEVPLIEELGGEVKILPYVSNISTTAIVNRIYQTFSKLPSI
ncbi:MAG: Bifunctional protein HldE [Chroococcidiopsis cubana SAG 39.79]|uniref:Bifunctional protein HldE n=1 Tax=Chroococcidiopsis cubana SAG 39.79 TaxID=388085 RepID=A0AB37UKA0_9CYAN|nr:D-glycero-beta-D-manno-heptose 1-phosphate adenylyltransferase [Chroococcidiopsis cubana]MDZ4875211.1 Bifunctional protein HldE [Chroococcidiopsis cubana SAG 39.79]PSB66422.1 D-glycero-beta-D-manno-heptose 1-phosphate adenylyltransferase [Chroococcidiopsis cubana CCALA 043]RUT11816.1 bifunctional protein HldE [Chroococcidiopsis cubana SAG 39.79]